MRSCLVPDLGAEVLRLLLVVFGAGQVSRSAPGLQADNRSHSRPVRRHPSHRSSLVRAWAIPSVASSAAAARNIRRERRLNTLPPDQVVARIHRCDRGNGGRLAGGLAAVPAGPAAMMYVDSPSRGARRSSPTSGSPARGRSAATAGTACGFLDCQPWAGAPKWWIRPVAIDGRILQVARSGFLWNPAWPRRQSWVSCRASRWRTGRRARERRGLDVLAKLRATCRSR